MTASGAEILLIRHAPAATGGRVTGWRDVGILPVTLSPLPPPDRLIVSPALRCLQTAALLFPGVAPEQDARLREQNFGEWEGADPAHIPDLGRLEPEVLARQCPPGGESFADLCARTTPALTALRGRVTVVAHAGTVRAALALALGHCGTALAFEVAPLSTTLLRVTPEGEWIVSYVNRML